MPTYQEIADSRLFGKIIAAMVIGIILLVISFRPYGFELNEENKTIYIFVLGAATTLLFK